MKIDKKNNRIFTIGSTPLVIRRQRRLPFCFQRNGSLTGFTLIEIMVVVVIIILITSVTVIAINNARIRTRDAIIITSLEQVKGLAETVYNPENQYGELKDHPNILEIKNKIVEMGIDFRLHHYGAFTGISGDDWSRYCSYAELASDPSVVVCVDWKGNKTIEKAVKINCTELAVPKPNCEYRD